jgi:hypothetical protein
MHNEIKDFSLLAVVIRETLLLGKFMINPRKLIKESKILNQRVVWQLKGGYC